jgi:hypothetical protein
VHSQTRLIEFGRFAAERRAHRGLGLARASQIRSQQQRQRGWKLYSFHAPETECIGKGNPHRKHRAYQGDAEDKDGHRSMRPDTGGHS